MPKELQTLTFNAFGEIRYEKLEGRDHVVVPTSMIVEGVLNGSKGALYYPADELGKAPQIWNHRPIVVYHPEQGSACSPEVLNTRKIGITLNTGWGAPKLRTESWIDVLRANEVDKRIIENIEAKKPVEVSTGLWTENEDTSGEFNGKPYVAIARNYVPDHLAILPDQIGACSLADGAGLLVANKLNGQPIDSHTISQIMAQTGLRPPVLNEKSFGEITSELYTQIQARFGYNCYIDGVFEGWFVYCHDGKTYKLSYKKTDKEVTVGTNPVEVYRTTKYITVNGEGLQTVSNDPKPAPVPKPSEKGQTMNKDQAIQLLITNGGYEESDRATLNAMDEAKLVKLASKVQTPTTTNTQVAPASPPPVLIENNGPADLNKWLASAPVAVQSLVNNALRAEATQKAELVQKITANKSNKFTADFLQTQELPILQGIAALAVSPTQNSAPVVNYFGGQGAPQQQGPTNNGEDEEVYEAPTMNFENPLAKVG